MSQVEVAFAVAVARGNLKDISLLLLCLVCLLLSESLKDLRCYGEGPSVCVVDMGCQSIGYVDFSTSVGL